VSTIACASAQASWTSVNCFLNMFLNMVDTLVEGREFCRTLSPRRAQPLAEDGFYYSHLCTVGDTIRCLEKSQTIPFWGHFRTWARAVARSPLPRIVLQNSFCITDTIFPSNADIRQNSLQQKNCSDSLADGRWQLLLLFVSGTTSRSKSYRLVCSDVYPKEACNKDYDDHDTNDVKNVHCTLPLSHARLQYESTMLQQQTF
jgi:hypothetical protein